MSNHIRVSGFKCHLLHGKCVYSVVRQATDEHIDKWCKLFHRLLKTAHTLSVAFQPVRSPMQSQNVSFLSVFHVFTIRSHFFRDVSARAGAQAKSERIVFVRFLRVYDTFSLFPRRFSPHGASSKVRTYRFCPFFTCLRYVLTFSAAFQPVRSPMQSQNVSFLSIFCVFTIRFHFFRSVSACAGLQAESERIVFVRFLRVYDTFSLFPQRFSL